MNNEGKNIDWSDFDKRMRWASLSFVGLPIGIILTLIALGTETYLLLIPGIALLISYFGFTNHLQEFKCPKCGKSFTTQDNPAVVRSAGLRAISTTKCASCGVER